jgi:hypothetical protein
MNKDDMWTSGYDQMKNVYSPYTSGADDYDTNGAVSRGGQRDGGYSKRKTESEIKQQRDQQEQEAQLILQEIVALAKASLKAEGHGDTKAGVAGKLNLLADLRAMICAGDDISKMLEKIDTLERAIQGS